jgi:hypothetical protein
MPPRAARPGDLASAGVSDRYAKSRRTTWSGYLLQAGDNCVLRAGYDPCSNPIQASREWA